MAAVIARAFLGPVEQARPSGPRQGLKPVVAIAALFVGGLLVDMHRHELCLGIGSAGQRGQFQDDRVGLFGGDKQVELVGRRGRGGDGDGLQVKEGAFIPGQAGLNPVVQVIQDFGLYVGMAAREGLPALGRGDDGEAFIGLDCPLVFGAGQRGGGDEMDPSGRRAAVAVAGDPEPLVLIYLPEVQIGALLNVLPAICSPQPVVLDADGRRGRRRPGVRRG